MADDHGRRRQLYGIRELGGHLIHRAAADMVRAIAAGNSWDYASFGQTYRDEFFEIVAKSMAAAPGEWIDGIQLAETFNGACPNMIKDDVNHWSVLIPRAIENAWRAAHTLDIRHASSTCRVEAELKFRWEKAGRPMYCVFDVLMRRPRRTICIDWKSHSIDNADIAQIRHYLDYLHYREGIPASELYGFAVNLHREEIVRVKYEPYKLGRTVSLASILPAARSSAASPRAPFPANPDPDLCLSCPYAGMCPAAVKSGIAPGTHDELTTVGDYFPSAALEGRP